MNYMFNFAGYSATTWDIGDLSGWNTANVTNMDFMFDGAGDEAARARALNLSGWNVAKVTTHANFKTKTATWITEPSWAQ